MQNCGITLRTAKKGRAWLPTLMKHESRWELARQSFDELCGSYEVMEKQNGQFTIRICWVTYVVQVLVRIQDRNASSPYVHSVKKEHTQLINNGINTMKQTGLTILQIFVKNGPLNWNPRAQINLRRVLRFEKFVFPIHLIGTTATVKDFHFKKFSVYRVSPQKLDTVWFHAT
jgi:hypothetical protein